MSNEAHEKQQIEYALLAADNTSEGLLVTDKDDLVLWINPGFERITGYTLEDMLGKRPLDLLSGPSTSDSSFGELRQKLRHRQSIDIEIEYYRKDGTPFWMESKITPIFSADGKHTHYMSSSRDITERKDLEQKSLASIERELIRQTERKTLSQMGEWLYSAQSLKELLMVIQKSLLTLIPEANGQLFIYSNSRNTLDLAATWGKPLGSTQMDAEDCWSLRRGRAYSHGTQNIEFACSHVHKDDLEAPFFCLPIIAHGQTIGMLHLHFSDVQREEYKDRSPEYNDFFNQRWELALLCAEQISLAVANVRLRQELEDQSVRDPLTNLWNRRWLLEAAHKEVDKFRTDGVPLSMISIDVDHFKKFNDHHGHDAGDLVLRAIGAKMTEVFPQNAAACRIGGEEFTVLCQGMTLAKASDLAEQFRNAVRHLSVRYSGANLPSITVSAGVASLTSSDHGVVDIMKLADQALYRAKRQGRNTVKTQNDLVTENGEVDAGLAVVSPTQKPTSRLPDAI